MNQAQRYEHLVGLTEGKKLDSDYRAAFYILSSVPELFEAAKKCVDSYGISFDKIKRTCKGNLEEYQSQLLSMAHNLFSWNSRTTAMPHELSRLTYPWMEIACNAIFISSGEVSVQIQENESGEPELVLDAAPYEKTKRIYEGLQRMGERLAVQMKEADAEEREGEEDWER